MGKRVFADEMKAAIDAAEAEGLFYLDDIKAFVIPRLTDELKAVEIIDRVTCTAAKDGVDFNVQTKKAHDAEARIKALPRGKAIIVRQEFQSGKANHTFLYSYGNGDVNTSIGHTYDDEPTAEEISKAVIGQEIYLCQQQMIQDRFIERGRKFIKEYEVRPGDDFRGEIRISGKRWRRVVVDSFLSEDKLKVIISGNGSGRFDTILSAGDLADTVARGSLRAPREPKPVVEEPAEEESATPSYGF